MPRSLYLPTKAYISQKLGFHRLLSAFLGFWCLLAAAAVGFCRLARLGIRSVSAAAPPPTRRKGRAALDRDSHLAKSGASATLPAPAAWRKKSESKRAWNCGRNRFLFCFKPRRWRSTVTRSLHSHAQGWRSARVESRRKLPLRIALRRAAPAMTAKKTGQPPARSAPSVGR